MLSIQSDKVILSRFVQPEKAPDKIFPPVTVTALRELGK